MAETTPEAHAAMQECWREAVAAMIEEGADPIVVVACMMEVAIAARLVLIGPRQLSTDLMNGAVRAAALADEAEGDRAQPSRQKPH